MSLHHLTADGRYSVSGESIEDALSISPRNEATLFTNCDKFDLVAIYDNASEDPRAPVSLLFQAIYEKSFRKFLRHMPCSSLVDFRPGSATTATLN